MDETTEMIKEKTKVKIYNKSNNPYPAYALPGSSGMDLRADLKDPIRLLSMDRVLVPINIHIQLPKGYEAQIRPRSGLASKSGITVLNSPGTIDESYTGNIMVLLVNISHEPFLIKHGERIAQMVFAKYEEIEWNEVNSIEDLEKTERGQGGFGSTGTN